MTPTEFRRQAEHRFGAHASDAVTSAMYLGIDLGTSELKVLLLDDGHRVVASAGEPLATSRPHPLLERAGPGALVGGARLGDAAPARSAPAATRRACGRSVCPARCTAPCCSMPPTRCCGRRSCGTTAAAHGSARRSRPRCRRCVTITGNLAMPGFTAPKLLWVREHEPPALRAHARACCCRRTGCASASPASTSARCPTPRARCGSTSAGAPGPTSCSPLCHLSRAHMPRLVEGSEISGQLRAALAARWGLPVGGRRGRRRWRQRGERGRHRRGAADARASSRSAPRVSASCRAIAFTPNPARGVHAFCHALPRALAPDVGDAVGRQRAALGLQAARHRRPRRSCCDRVGVAQRARSARGRRSSCPT